MPNATAAPNRVRTQVFPARLVTIVNRLFARLASIDTAGAEGSAGATGSAAKAGMTAMVGRMRAPPVPVTPRLVLSIALPFVVGGPKFPAGFRRRLAGRF